MREHALQEAPGLLENIEMNMTTSVNMNMNDVLSLFLLDCVRNLVLAAFPDGTEILHLISTSSNHLEGGDLEYVDLFRIRLSHCLPTCCVCTLFTLSVCMLCLHFLRLVCLS